MKVVILAGGFGTRISEFTKLVPKPMIRLAGKPIIYYIMKHYSKYGYKDFIVATGYKNQEINKFFKKKFFDWKVNTIYTGLNTMTGGRIKRLEKYLKNESFMLTYGDGLSNVNIKKLVSFHKRNKKIATLTAVRPPARFGAIKISRNKVIYFKEKSKLDEGWINGGFFVLDKDIFKFIKNDQTFFEREPLQTISKKSELLAFKHRGFWQCMDTKRDKDLLEKMFKQKKIKF
jgi:glucose-1-phosphate cytidylyltransferase